MADNSMSSVSGGEFGVLSDTYYSYAYGSYNYDKSEFWYVKYIL